MNTHQKAFAKLLGSTHGRYRDYEVFRDWCEIAAITISNTVDLRFYEEREKRYLEAIKKYQPDEVTALAQLLGTVSLGLDDHLCDFLGQTFMELDFGSHWAGQFFTPYDVARMMAEITMADAPDNPAKPFITICDPAVGAGCMLIAAADALKARGVDYQSGCHMTGIDIDITAVHMAYIQLSVIGAPAVIYHGDSLSQETWSTWATPAHVMGFWDAKLQTRESVTA